jgi:hypothetical protein
MTVDEQVAAAPMMAAAAGGAPAGVAASNSGVTTSTGSAGESACALAPGRVAPSNWSGLALLAAAIAVLRGRRPLRREPHF